MVKISDDWELVALLFGIDDHTCNRIVAGFDLLAFALITPQVISETALVSLQGASRRMASRIDAFLPIIIKKTEPLMAMTALVMLPLFFYVFPDRVDAHGPLWLMIIVWSLAFLVFVVTVIIFFSRAIELIVKLTANIAVRQRVFWIGASLFFIARALVLAHG